jgi:hypothetical protein
MMDRESPEMPTKACQRLDIRQNTQTRGHVAVVLGLVPGCVSHHLLRWISGFNRTEPAMPKDCDKYKEGTHDEFHVSSIHALEGEKGRPFRVGGESGEEGPRLQRITDCQQVTASSSYLLPACVE